MEQQIDEIKPQLEKQIKMELEQTWEDKVKVLEDQHFKQMNEQEASFQQRLREVQEAQFDEAMEQCDLESKKLKEINDELRKELKAKEIQFG